jgi:phosphate transport system protein
MASHLQRAIDRLMKMLVALSAKVEESVKRSIRALDESDMELARQVIKNDRDIDRQEIDVEEECLKILALHQPVAVDLRYIVAVLKINNDLERIGDLAQNISQNVTRILEAPLNMRAQHFDLQGIYNNAREMLKNSLDAVVKQDADMAEKVLKADDEVDRLNREFAQEVIEEVKKNPEKAYVLHQYINISRHLERIADHATNIAEDVIYLIKGDIIRHGVHL